MDVGEAAMRRAGQIALGILGALLASVAVADQEGLPELAGKVGTLYQAGQYAEAIPLAQRLVRLAEGRFGPDDPVSAEALHILAVLLWKQGRHAESEPLFRRALVIAERTFGKQNSEITTILNDLALLLKAQGRYAEAQSIWVRLHFDKGGSLM